MVALYALRFFASIGIYFHHLNYPIGIATICVTFFFVMSGFTMSYSMSQKEFIISKKSLKKFYYQRMVKLYPLYILTFIISIPIMNYLNIKFNIKNILIHLLLLQSIYPNDNEVFMFNGLSWFVADIMLFYLVTPLIFFLLRKLNLTENIKSLLLISMIICVIAFYISFRFKWEMVPYSFAWWFIYISPFFRIFDYILGFLFGLIFINLNNLISIKPNNTFIFSILEILSLVFLYLSYNSQYLQIDSLRYGIYYVPSSLFILIIFAFGRGIISRILKIKPLKLLGLHSFVIYMIHQLIISYTSILLGNSMYTPEKSMINNLKTAVYLFFIIVCMSEIIIKYFSENVEKLLLKKQ